MRGTTHNKIWVLEFINHIGSMVLELTSRERYIQLEKLFKSIWWTHILSVLVYLGCHNKILQMGWLKQKFISHGSRG